MEKVYPSQSPPSFMLTEKQTWWLATFNHVDKGKQGLKNGKIGQEKLYS